MMHIGFLSMDWKEMNMMIKMFYGIRKNKGKKG